MSDRFRPWQPYGGGVRFYAEGLGRCDLCKVLRTAERMEGGDFLGWDVLCKCASPMGALLRGNAHENSSRDWRMGACRKRCGNIAKHADNYVCAACRAAHKLDVWIRHMETEMRQAKRLLSTANKIVDKEIANEPMELDPRHAQ